MGLGFALAIGDYRWLGQSLRSLLWGTLIAIGLSALIVYVSPLQTVTQEIASRTRPSLFDLGVALFSALAGAYAMIRGREGTIVGVAIATALMPPLAVVGFGLATANWTVFSGALFLYVTNLITIAFTAAIMARIYGFRTSLSQTQSRLQNILITAVFMGLAIPLGLSLRQIAFESSSARLIRSELLEPFDERSRLSQVDIEWDAEPIAVDATILTPRLNAAAEQQARDAIENTLNAPIALTLTQYQVGTSATAAEQAQLVAANTREEEEAASRAVAQLRSQLALIAGVAPDDVVIDRESRRASVRAAALPGADLTTYRTLERRLSDRVEGWEIALRPPLRALPPIPVERGDDDALILPDSSTRALSLLIWAMQRNEADVVLEGPPEEREHLRALLDERGLTVTGRDGPSPVRPSWIIGEDR